MRAFSQYFLEGTRKRLGQAAGVACLLGMMVVPALAQDASPDRLVAEWMLRMGGSVVLEGQHTPISDVAESPIFGFLCTNFELHRNHPVGFRAGR